MSDRRQHKRRPFGSAVEFFHEAAQREFPARCVDISEGGMLMYVPASTPVQAGQVIRVNVHDTPAPEPAKPAEHGKYARVVRVDRHQLMSIGHLAIGVAFEKSGAN